jgi:hypothetical protein
MIEGNGEVCSYFGDRTPYGMISFLEERKKGEGSSKCKPKGRITALTKILSYFEPILDLLNYNTAVSYWGYSFSYWRLC